MSVLKKAKGKPKGPAINNRYEWVEFEGKDGEIYKLKVRTSLIYDEIERLIGLNVNTDREKLWEECHRYVEEWNLQVVLTNSEGVDEYYDVAAPKEGGPESFRYAPPSLIYAVVGAIMDEGFKKVDPKSLKPVETTGEQLSVS